MAYPITFNDTYPAGFLGTDDGAAKASFSIDDASTYSVTVVGTVNAPGDVINLTYGADAPAGYAGTTIQITATQYDNSNMILFTSTAIPPGDTTAQTYRYVLSNTQVYGNPPPAGQTRTRFTATPDTPGGTTYSGGNYNEAAAPCFVSGTRIRVLRRDQAVDVAVEDLAVGDIAVTASGEHRRICWIGHNSVYPRRVRHRSEVMPICISANAFGDHKPARDLRVSPGHSICFDVLGEVLIPASALVNGSTICQEDVERVTYWHVEVDGGHEVLLAENMPAESYIDMANRAFFIENAIVNLDARPSGRAVSHADFCRPFHESGAIVDMVRDRLRHRAAELIKGEAGARGGSSIAA